MIDPDMHDNFRVIIKNGGAMIKSQIYPVFDFEHAANRWLDRFAIEILTDTGWFYDAEAEVHRRKVVQVPPFNELSFVIEFTAQRNG